MQFRLMYNFTMKLKVKEQIKVLLSQEWIKQKDLAAVLSKKKQDIFIRQQIYHKNLAEAR